MEEMIFSAVTQEFTTSPAFVQNSGQTQKWILCSMPFSKRPKTVSFLKGGTIHESPYKLISDEEPECTKKITVSAD